MMRMAQTKAQALPRTVDVLRATIPNASRMRQKKSRSSHSFFPPLTRFFAMHHSFALGVGSARIERSAPLLSSFPQQRLSLGQGDSSQPDRKSTRLNSSHL